MKTLRFVPLFFAAAISAYAGPHVVGGEKSKVSTLPWWGLVPNMRFQCCWYQEEINEGGLVTKIEIQFDHYGRGTPPSYFFNCKILLCHTSLKYLKEHFDLNYDGHEPVEVFSGTFVVPADLVPGQWFSLDIDPTFRYNNKDNLLLEVIYFGGGGAENAFWISEIGQPGYLYTLTPETEHKGSLRPDRGYVAKIHIGYTGLTPASLGRVKALYY